MKLLRKVGATSQILQVFIRDSSSATGAGLTGLTSASSGLTAYYHRDTDTTATAISLVTMTVGTFTSSGFKEIDSTNMPGWYQFCPPNAALTTGASSVGIHLKGATNMAPLPIEIDLDGQVDVTAWNGTAVSAPATAGIPDVNVKNIVNVAATLDANNALNVSAKYLAGTALTGRDIGASVLLSAGTSTGQLDFTSGVVKANATQWLGGTIPPVNVTGVPLVDAKYLLGTVFSTPATAGVLDVNAKNINNVATTSVTTISANIGNTQPINFTGTAGSALVKTDVIDWNSTAVTTPNTAGTPLVDVGRIKGTTSAGAAGYVGVDWNAINAPTTTVNLSGTTISASQIVASVSGAVGSVTGNVGGNVAGNVVGSVASVTGAVGSITSPGNIFDVVLASHLTSGTTGAALNAAGSAGDPWSTALPGAYGAGTAGYIVGNRLDTTVSSRMATYTQPTGFLAATFPTSVGTSTYAGADTSGTTTLLTRLPSAISLSAGAVTVGTNNDKTGYTLTQSFPPNFGSLVITAGGHITAVDTLTNAPADSSGVTTLLTRVTGAVLLASGYTAPDNTNIGLIASKLPVNTIADETLIIAATNAIITAVGSPLQTSAYTAPPTAAQNADGLLARNIAGGSSSGHTVAQALAAVRNKITIVAGVLTVYAQDGTTPLWTANLTADGTALPITAVAPTA